MRNVKELLQEIDKYGLFVPPNFNREESVLQKCYNGCGPDWMPEKIRNWLTSHFEFFESAFMIHDYEFTQSDKSDSGFDCANSRLHANCWRLVTLKISKYNFPKRILYYARSHEIYAACQMFGKSAWND